MLQAAIVERLVERDPDAALDEVRRLSTVVGTALAATRSFISEVHPVVLDDLGLVPALRRAAADRGRASGVAVDFSSHGPDRRLPQEREAALYHVVDEGLGGMVASHPVRVSVRLTWSGGRVDASIGAQAASAGAGEEWVDQADAGRAAGSPEMPSVLAEMIDDRRTALRAARSQGRLPEASWEAIRGRAAAAGIEASRSDDGSELRFGLAWESSSTPSA